MNNILKYLNNISPKLSRFSIHTYKVNYNAINTCFVFYHKSKREHVFYEKENKIFSFT